MQQYATELFEWTKLESLGGRLNPGNKQDDGSIELNRLSPNLSFSGFIFDFPKLEFLEKFEKECHDPILELHRCGPPLTVCSHQQPWWTVKYSWFQPESLDAIK
nr:uncharacterized protein LOC106677309 [Halyomorpha halys]